MMSYHSFSPAHSYKHAIVSSLIPFDSSLPADSNRLLPDLIRLLVVELPSSLYLCSPASIFKLLAAECYKHATALSSIPLTSSRRVESNKLSSWCRAQLPGELSSLSTQLTDTGMPPPRAKYQSIRLSRLILMVRSPALADPWVMSYHSFSPVDSYRHATVSSLIPFDSSRPADSNGPLPDSIPPPVV